MCAHDQSSIFSTGGKFCPDYGLLLELHTLTLLARSYALLAEGSKVSSQPCFTILPDRTFHVFGMGHMIRNRLPSSMNKYIGTAVRHHVDSQELSASLVTKCLKSLLLLINTQHYLLFQIAICHQWRQRTLIFHPASYTVMTVDNSL